ncbi:hypothetical protein DFH09DRAFT_1354843 [Mycena vulgaris]|nr:hypothetical protein DFH09DRAFT_1354843 [Mycena vulgaris]
MDKDSPISNRKRPRENETPSQRLKREKAAERQRRKRERDRAASGLAPTPMPFPPQNHPDPHYPHPAHHHQPPPDSYLNNTPPNSAPPEDNLSPDEQARRERVRAAARERQRKHRQLVKQRKMRELGLDMGNEIMPGMDEVHYRVNAEGQYQQVMAHEIQQQQAQAQAQAAHQHHLQQQAAHAQAQGQSAPQGEPPFPQGPAHGGQTFATTLLLSFSCAPLLKQHLLRTLNMTNDELASLEPIIAEAWDRWDHGRRIGYDHAQQQQEQGFPPGGVPVPVPGGAAPYPPPYAPGAAGDDFRGRFQRVMTVPAPFRSSFNNPNGNGEGGATTPSSASGSVNGAGGVDAIDPHLGGKDAEGLKDE